MIGRLRQRHSFIPQGALLLDLLRCGVRSPHCLCLSPQPWGSDLDFSVKSTTLLDISTILSTGGEVTSEKPTIDWRRAVGTRPVFTTGHSSSYYDSSTACIVRYVPGRQSDCTAFLTKNFLRRNCSRTMASEIFNAPRHHRTYWR